MWNNTQDAGERHVRFLTLMKTCSAQARCSLFNDIPMGKCSVVSLYTCSLTCTCFPATCEEQRRSYQFSQNVLKVNLPQICMCLVRIGWDERVLHTWSIVVSCVRIYAPGWRTQCPKQLVCPVNIGWVNEWNGLSKTGIQVLWLGIPWLQVPFSVFSK